MTTSTFQAMPHCGPEASIPPGFRVADDQGEPGFLPRDQYWVERGSRIEGRHADEVILSFRQFLDSLEPHERVEVLESVYESYCYDCGEEWDCCECEEW